MRSMMKWSERPALGSIYEMDTLGFLADYVMPFLPDPDLRIFMHAAPRQLGVTGEGPADVRPVTLSALVDGGQGPNKWPILHGEHHTRTVAQAALARLVEARILVRKAGGAPTCRVTEVEVEPEYVVNTCLQDWTYVPFWSTWDDYTIELYLEDVRRETVPVPGTSPDYQRLMKRLERTP